MATKRVYVRNEAISAMFARSGEVGALNSRIMARITARAIAAAPSRSGALKAAHRNGGALKRGKYVNIGTVYNTSEHASYVHEGTYGPILPKTSTKMHLPAGGGYSARALSSVAGQRANPWMTRAANRVLSTYGVHVP